MKTEFGAYELRKQIGKGGMAWVYLAVQRALDRAVAIKILFPHLAEDEKFVARFELEARAAAKMRHENIVQVYDYGKFEDHRYIAMEYVDGLNLREWLDAHGTPPLDVALVMLRDLCRGLEHAHGRDIVHRDIKPSNVMLTPEGTVKLMDFGLARRAEDHTVMTEHGAMLGTVPYMSTEQSLGKHVGKPSDIFSLGVVCYELLGGRRPFLGDTQSAITEAILHDEPRPLAGLNPLVPDRLMAAIGHMLEKDAARRCQDIAEVRQVLDELIVEQGIFHDRALVAQYVGDPKRVGQDLVRARLARHLERGAACEREEPAAIDRAIQEYRCALHLDPENRVARVALEKLAQAQVKLAAAGSAPPSALPAERESAPFTADAKGVAGGPAAEPTPAAAARSVSQLPAAGPMPGRKPPSPPPGGLVAPATRTPAATEAPEARDGRAKRVLIAVSAGLLTTMVALIAILILRRPPEPRLGPREEETPTLAVPTVTPVDTTVQVKDPIVDTTTTPEPGRVTLIVITDPLGAAVSVDNSPAKDSPANFEDLPAGPHRVRIVKQGFLTKTRRVEVFAGRDTQIILTLQEDQSSTTTPPTQEVSQVTTQRAHSLIVETVPLNALVRLDDQTERASPARFEAVGMGHHTVRITLEAHRSFETQIAFSARRDSTIEVQLEPAAGAGTLSLQAFPAGDYFVDKTLRAANRTAVRIAVLPGKHLVEMRNPLLYGEPTRNNVRVEAGEVVGLKADFTEGVGFLRVTTAGDVQARVVVNGREQPNPAPGLFPVKCGKRAEFRIRLVREGHETAEGLVTRTVAQRETVDVHFTWK